MLATAPEAPGHHSFAARTDRERMEYACTDNNRDAEEGLLQPGALDGSGRDGTATATPSTYPAGATSRPD